MDGSEQVLVSKEDDKIGVLDGYVDLTTMDTDDVIVIRQFMQVKAAGAYVKYAEESYSGPQTIPLLHIITKTANFRRAILQALGSLINSPHPHFTLLIYR